MINPTYPGVYVREESSGARAVAGVATSITAFVGMTQRGPLLQPVRVFGVPDFERAFGPGQNAGAMAAQVRLFFDNGGGVAWVTRIASGAEQADITLRNEAQVDTLRLTALEHGVDGNHLRAEVNYDTISPEERFSLRLYRRLVSATGTVTEADIETYTNLSMNPADGNFVASALHGASRLVEATALEAVALLPESVLFSGLILPTDATEAANTIRSRIGGPGTANFRLRHNGAPPITVMVEITGGDAIATIVTNIANAITTALAASGVTQAVTGAQINTGSRRQITLTMPGASFEILPGSGTDLAAALMLTNGQGAVYVDRWSLNRPAPTGVVSILHNAVGQQNLSRLLTFAGTAKAEVAEWEIADASTAGSPGAQPITYPVPTGTMIEGMAFAPTVAGDLSQGAMLNVRENLTALAAAINGDANRRWVARVHGYRLSLIPAFSEMSDAGLNTSVSTAPVTNLGAGTNILNLSSRPANVRAYTLGTNGSGVGGGLFQNRAGATDGDDGLLPGEDEYRAAFDVMERRVDLFNLMVLPRARAEDGTQSDADRKPAFDAASAFCARQRAFLLVDPPATDAARRWTDATTAESGVDALRIGIDSRNSAVFWPRLKMANGTYQDPGGAMAGLMARIDGTRGVWKAAAGVEATIRGVAGLEYPMSDPDNGVINPKAVNALRVFPDGVLSWGARTLVGFNDSGNIDDKYIPVRRTMLFIEESLYRGLRFAVFEPNDEPLWAQIRLAAGSFMNTLFRQGAFAGQKASDAYFVLCDRSTTTATDQNLGIVNVIVGFAPLKPAEFVILTVKQIAGQAQT